MGKKKGEGNPNPTTSELKEGNYLLGSPTFQPLENGRFKCVETGHELLAHSRDSYAVSKHCRLGLIDSAVFLNKSPLNMFHQDPLSRSKLICKLTGVSINKSEEHIWKHMNGKRFLNMLEKKETEIEMLNCATEKQDEEKEVKKNEDDGLKKKKKNEDGGLKKKKKKKVEEKVDQINNEETDSTGENGESGEEVDFWIPPEGERWDHDDGGGGDRWGSDLEGASSGDEDAGGEEDNEEAVELSKRTKRMSLEMGPSSFASRKKKKKINVAVEVSKKQ